MNYILKVLTFKFTLSIKSKSTHAMVVSQCLGCAILIKNADIAPANTYASTDVSTSNNCKQQHLLIGKVGVLIVPTICDTVHTIFYNSADDKLSNRIICKVNTKLSQTNKDTM